MARGGKRAGAGRPRKQFARPAARQPQPDLFGTPTPPSDDASASYEDAVDYLSAVVSGDEAPDPVRVAAAKALLPFQSARQRVPLRSSPPRQLQEKEKIAAEAAAREEWCQRANEIRARHGRKTEP